MSHKGSPGDPVEENDRMAPPASTCHGWVLRITASHAAGGSASTLVDVAMEVGGRKGEETRKEIMGRWNTGGKEQGNIQAHR